MKTKRSIVKRMLNCVADFPPSDKLMGPSEPRTTVQIYFCELCNGPGTCYIRATKQRLCMTCLKTRTMLLSGTRHVIQADADGVPHLILKPERRKKKRHRPSPERLYFYNLQDGCCYYCNKKVPSVDSRSWTIEHKLPVCRGGTNQISNLAGACNDCNHKKGPLTEHEFNTAKSDADRKETIKNVCLELKNRIK